MSKDFFALAGSIHRNYKEETKYPLQEDTVSLSDRDAYDAVLWHDENGSYFSIKNRASVEKREEAWLAPSQALKLFDILQGQCERLQELCDNKEGTAL